MQVVASPLVLPISDLRTDLNSVVEMAADTREPIFMTKNGKPALVVFDNDAYEEMRMHDRMVMKIREAEIEAKYHPESVSLDSFNKRMEDMLDMLEAQ